MTAILASVLIGAGIGAALGHTGQCSGGTCPLTANWRRGAIYGAVLGLAFGLSAGRGSRAYPAPKHVAAVDESRFEAEVLKSDAPVVVDFFATWCGPCKALAPTLDALAGEFAPRLKFVQVDVDKAPALAGRYGVQGVPTLMFFRDGAVVGFLSGNQRRDVLQARFEDLAARGPAPAAPTP